MITDLIYGLGLVAILEGLVLALAPLRFDELLTILREMAPDKRRSLGLIVMALGVVLVWGATFISF